MILIVVGELPCGIDALIEALKAHGRPTVHIPAPGWILDIHIPSLDTCAMWTILGAGVPLMRRWTHVSTPLGLYGVGLVLGIMISHLGPCRRVPPALPSTQINVLSYQDWRKSDVQQLFASVATDATQRCLMLAPDYAVSPRLSGIQIIGFSPTDSVDAIVRRVLA
jgi:hypothetical protein